ncbi:MAG: hypothetical protein DIU78_010380 [Pseudomonadota bacterium]
MNEPRRLLEGSCSALERALLDAGVSYRSSPEAHAKTLAALGLAGSAAAVTAGAAGAAALSGQPVVGSSVAAKLGWTKLLTTFAMVGTVAGLPAGYFVWESAREAKEPAVSTPPAEPVRATRVAPAPVVEAPAQAPEPSDVVTEPVQQAPSARIVSRPAVEEPVSSAALLGAELETLDAARKALAAGNAKAALTLLDAYGRAHPNGRLGIEAEVLRIDALAKSGQNGVARQRAERFLRRYPNGVLAARVRRILDE